jgi:hypothetical protein
MSIKSRVLKSIQDSSRGELENALIQALIALDTTAKREGITGTNASRIKTFLSNNRALLTRAGLIFLEFRGTVILKSLNASGQLVDQTLEEILYHVLRCHLLHEGEIPPQIIFTKDQRFGSDDQGRVILPETFIFGILMCVIGSHSNTGERLNKPIGITIHGKKYLIDSLWGMKDEIHKIFRGEETTIKPIVE